MTRYSLDNPTPVDWHVPRTMPLKGEVHIWQWHVDEHFIDASGVDSLANDEQSRYARLVTPQLRHRYLSAHSGLRRLLATYLQCPPQEVKYEVSAYGKPQLPDSPLHFNLSHSGDVVMVAVATDEVGIDVEQLRPVTSMDSLAAKCFTPAELASFGELDDHQRTVAFAAVWTRKEAVLKCLGLGLHASPGELDVGIAAEACRTVAIPAKWNAPHRTCWVFGEQSPASTLVAVATTAPVQRYAAFTPKI